MSEQIRTFRQAAWYDDGDVVQEMEACENGTWVRWTDHVAAMHRRPPVDSVGVDRESWRIEVGKHVAIALSRCAKEHTPDYVEQMIEKCVNSIAALTAPADGCPACGANWDSEHNRCEGNCDKLLSEKEG